MSGRGSIYYCEACKCNISNPKSHLKAKKHKDNEENYFNAELPLFSSITGYDNSTIRRREDVPPRSASEQGLGSISNSTNLVVPESGDFFSVDNDSPENSNSSMDISNSNSTDTSGSTDTSSDPEITELEENEKLCKFSWGSSCVFHHQGIKHKKCWTGDSEAVRSYRDPTDFLKDRTALGIPRTNSPHTIKELLRCAMVESSMTEPQMQMVLNALNTAKRIGLSFSNLPETVAELKNEDKKVTQIQVETRYFGNDTFYYLHPISLLEQILATDFLTETFVDQIKSSQFYGYRFIDTSNKFKRKWEEMQEKGIIFFDSNMEIPNIFVAVNFFVDEYRWDITTKDNGIYFSVPSLGQDTNATENSKYLIGIIPPNSSEQEVLDWIIVNTEWVLIGGSVVTYFAPFKKECRVYGYLHCVIGDDIGFRAQTNFMKPTCKNSSRYFDRDHSEFSNISEPIDRRDFKRNIDLENIHNMLQQEKAICIPAKKLANTFGLNWRNIKKQNSYLFNLPFNDDYKMLNPPCELHLVRLGLAKSLLEEFSLKYGRDYCEYWNRALFRKVIYINVEDKTPCVSQNISGSHMSQILERGATIHELAVTESNSDELTLWSSLKEISVILRRTEISEEENRSLSTKIHDWKLAFLRVFQKAWSKPNFESIDFFPHAIRELGSSRFFSGESYEPLHRESKSALKKCRKTNRFEGMITTVARRKSYYLHGVVLQNKKIFL